MRAKYKVFTIFAIIGVVSVGFGAWAYANKTSAEVTIPVDIVDQSALGTFDIDPLEYILDQELPPFEFNATFVPFKKGLADEYELTYHLELNPAFAEVISFGTLDTGSWTSDTLTSIPGNWKENQNPTNMTEYDALKARLGDFEMTLHLKAEEKAVEPVLPTSLSILPTDLVSLEVGESANLSIQSEPVDAVLNDPLWSSSNPSVLSVSQSGYLSALQAGSATITYSASGIQTTKTIIVTTPIILPTSLSILPAELTSIDVGETATLSIEATPLDAELSDEHWSSSNSSILSVDQSGLISGISAGSATITFSASGLETTKTISVEAVAIMPTSLSILPSELTTIEVGQKTFLSIQSDPVDAVLNAQYWRSSNSTILSVKQTGEISALKPGNATIIFSASGVETTKLIKVVAAPVLPTSLAIQPAELTSLNVGQTATLTILSEPVDAQLNSPLWSSSNNNVLTVSQSGVVSALMAGTSTITYSASGLEASKTITVSDAPVLPLSISILPASLTSILVGETSTLEAETNPIDAVRNNPLWSSNNTSVLTVNENGLITGIAPGNAIITYSASGKQATKTISVVSSSDKEDLFDGYYKAAKGLTGNALINKLRQITEVGRNGNYDWSRFESADESLTDSTSVTCIYSRLDYKKTDHDHGSNIGWNREHSYPQSKINSDAAKDNHHIFASDAQLNTARSNHLYGIVSGNYYRNDSYGRQSECKYNDGVFEPANAAKGEVARATMYVSMAYGEPIYAGKDGNFTSQELCFSWHESFGVTTREVVRNDKVQINQYNRNPFIDFPEFARMCFDPTYSGPGALI